MPKHQFGIMQKTPQPGKRYDTYEPGKYHCISVDDEFIEAKLSGFADIACFAHTVDEPIKGLAYCGITLIPPEALPRLADILCDAEGLEALVDMMKDAHNQNKFVIHFGI